MAIDVRMSTRYPHVGWADLDMNGVLTEIAILKNGENGLFFIKLLSLDEIDKQRLLRIITSRNNGNLPLWDLMSSKILGNGANSLEYFHQFVKVLTPQGQVISPVIGKVSTVAPKAPINFNQDAVAGVAAKQ